MGLQNDLDFDGDNDQRTVLVVHDTMPPFLDGRVRFTKQADLVLPLKDASSDMAVISRNGSALARAPPRHPPPQDTPLHPATAHCQQMASLLYPASSRYCQSELKIRA